MDVGSDIESNKSGFTDIKRPRERRKSVSNRLSGKKNKAELMKAITSGTAKKGKCRYECKFSWW